MDIITQVAANNQIIIGLQSIASPGRGGGDTMEKKREERIGEHLSNAQLKFLPGYSFTAVTNHPGLNSLVVVPNARANRLREARMRSLDILREFQRAKSLVPKRGKSTNGYGTAGHLRGLTKNARARILQGGAILSKRGSSASNAAFITLTVPGNMPGNRDIIPRWTGYICNRLLQVVRRAERRARDGCFEWIYCWEYQGRGWLHLHMVLQHSKPGVALKLGRNLRDLWFRLLHEISLKEDRCLFADASGKRCYLPQYWQSDVSPVTKDVSRYISKYVSKGGGTRQGKTSKRDWGRTFPLTRWWGMSRRLCQEAKAHQSQIRVTGLTEAQAVEVIQSLGKLLSLQQPTITYQYSFEIRRGNWHGGWGMKEIFYIPDDAFVRVRNALSSVLRALVGDIPHGLVHGYGALLHPFGFTHVPLDFPAFSGYNNL